MRFNLTALMDEETLKRIRDAVLGEAKKVARSVIDGTIETEIKRIVAKHVEGNWGGATKKMDEILVRHLKGLINDEGWSGIGDKITKLLDTRVTEAVERKLKMQTAWEGKTIGEQEEDIRRFARDEFKKLMSRL